MNLGIIGNQDVVVAGGFRIIENNGKDITIVTEIRILDIAKKKVIAEFIMKGPADDRLWNTVDAMTQKIADEMKSVLPNKNEWDPKRIFRI